MNIIDLIKAGRLAEARSALVEQVRSRPNDSEARTLLFQVQLLLGEWDKAGRHLEALASQDREANPAFVHYAAVLRAEQERRAVLGRQQSPSFLPATPAYADLHFQACSRLTDGNQEEAATLFTQIDELLPPVSGTVNGREFTGIRNTDTGLAPFLETFAHGRYVLVPFEHIRELTLSPPESLLDLIWATASLTTWEGLTVNCTLPVLYPDSCRHDNDLVKMGKQTEWLPLGGPFCRGVGQQVFDIGGEDVAILEITDIVFHFSDKGPDA
ncbi:MAG: type VI secretion system accessory protein TagJ [Thermodesulfobacteriota bacterium]